MRRSDLARLVALAAIWSMSFIFLRVVVPSLGPIWAATLRVLIGGTALVAWFALTGVHGRVREHWRAYLVVGTLNSALPFVLFAYGAQHLPASYLVILNAASPMFAALASAAWLDEPLGAAKIAGLVAGASGVALVSRAGPLVPDADFSLAIAASLGAALCYGLAGVWLKKYGAALRPIAVAGWSQMFAAIVLAPAAALAPLPTSVSPLVVGNMLALALVCSGIAYLLYYRLIADVGPTRAMTVTFLMPALGLIWGVWFLDESVTPPMIAGAALIVAGTAAVLRPALSMRREKA